MPVNLSIRNVPDDVMERLRQNHRSVRGECLAILEQAVSEPRKLTIRKVLEEVRRSGLRTPSESAAIIRADRDSNYGHDKDRNR
jgi:antitoxin FitA